MVHSDKTQTLATLTNWQSPPWQMLAVVTMVTTAGHRPVSPTRGEPARMPRRRPAVEQVSTNKQSVQAEEQERKKQRSPSLHHSSNTHTCFARCNHHFLSLSLHFPLFFLSSSLVPSHLELQSLACNSHRVLLQNELMFTINKSAEGKPQSSYSQDRVQDVTPPNTKPHSDHTILRFGTICVCVCGICIQYTPNLQCLFCDLILRLIKCTTEFCIYA